MSIIPGLDMLDGLKDLASRLPSDATLNRLIEAMPQLADLVTRLPSEDVIKDLSNMAGSLPSDRTLRDLARAISSLPDPQVLKDLVSMKPYLERMPTKQDIQEIMGQLKLVSEFLAALKG